MIEKGGGTFENLVNEWMENIFRKDKTPNTN